MESIPWVRCASGNVFHEKDQIVAPPILNGLRQMQYRGLKSGFFSENHDMLSDSPTDFAEWDVEHDNVIANDWNGEFEVNCFLTGI